METLLNFENVILTDEGFQSQWFSVEIFHDHDPSENRDNLLNGAKSTLVQDHKQRFLVSLRPNAGAEVRLTSCSLSLVESPGSAPVPNAFAWLPYNSPKELTVDSIQWHAPAGAPPTTRAEIDGVKLRTPSSQSGTGTRLFQLLFEVQAEISRPEQTRDTVCVWSLPILVQPSANKQTAAEPARAATSDPEFVPVTPAASAPSPASPTTTTGKRKGAGESPERKLIAENKRLKSENEKLMQEVKRLEEIAARIRSRPQVPADSQSQPPASSPKSPHDPES